MHGLTSRKWAIVDKDMGWVGGACQRGTQEVLCLASDQYTCEMTGKRYLYTVQPMWLLASWQMRAC